MKYRTKTMANLRGFWNRKCNTCNELKPARTHHCSVCQTCVFQMNHHCPFTNNCVGLENQRFFLLFIFYAFLGSLYYLFSIVSIWNHYVYKDHHMMMSYLVIFDSFSAGTLFLFNIWSWSVAGSGLTTVEFVGRQTGFKANYYDFTFTRVRDNLFKIFGTKSYFQLLSPSLRYNAFNGIEWSFQMKDLGFNEFGEVQGSNDEENVAIKGGQTELTNISHTMDEDPDGEMEAENTDIAI